MNKLGQELRKICVPINNFGCFQLLPTDASVDFFLVLSCLLDSSTTTFLRQLLSAFDTNEAGNTPLNLIQVWPEKKRGKHFTVSFGVFVEPVMKQCYYCWHSCFVSIALKVCFFIFSFFFILRDQMCNFENYSLGDFSHLMNGSGSLCHQPMNWSLVFLSFLYMFICLVKLIQYHGFKYHP